MRKKKAVVEGVKKDGKVKLKATVIPQDEIDGVYTIECACSNCGLGREFGNMGHVIEIPMGELVSEYIKSYRCPVCGCTTLHQI
jgi:rRNA maturation protein Nop10